MMLLLVSMSKVGTTPETKELRLGVGVQRVGFRVIEPVGQQRQRASSAPEEGGADSG